MPIRTRFHVWLFAAAVTALATVMASILDRVILAPDIYDAVRYSGPLTALMVSFPVTMMIGRLLRRLTLLQDDLMARLARDDLTGMRSRRDLTERAPLIQSQPGVVAMLDIDGFKAINDQCGHAVGDEVLRDVGAVLRSAARIGDELYRIGGEEFLLFLPDVPLGTAHQTVDRLRAAVEARCAVMVGEGRRAVTLSAGWVRKPAYQDLYRAKRAADVALYAAKRAGRNRTCTLDRAQSGGQPHNLNKPLPRNGSEARRASSEPA